MAHLPNDFTQRILKQYPNFAHKLLDALNSDAQLSVRLNPAKKKVVFDNATEVPWCPNAFYLQQRPVYTLDPLFHAGCYYPQEASSMFIHHVLSSLPFECNNPVLLDLCAAPGGKSTLMASFLNGSGLLVANEVIKSRANILAENIVKWGSNNVVVTQNDPSQIGGLYGFFDAVLVDAPCSGEGMFRKDAKARDEWSLSNTQLCSARQKRIVADIWPAIKEGGFLIYSTCTFNPDENEINLQWLLNQFDARIVSVDVDDSWGITQAAIGQGFGYAFLPHMVKGEGFFCAVAQKTSATQSFNFKRSHKSKVVKPSIPSGLVNNQSDYTFLEHKNQISAVLQTQFPLVEVLMEKLNVILSGTTLGFWVKGDFAPDHHLAMSQLYNFNFQTVDVDEKTALNYLRGETQLGIEPLKGWVLVTYKNVPLGFLKGLGNRFNNYYPKDWRIRMKL